MAQHEDLLAPSHGKCWTFITNHAAILLLVSGNPQITAQEISREVGITERAVRIIIHDLEKDGYITKIRLGRGVRYSVNPDQPLRHRSQQGIVVGKLLSALNVKQKLTSDALPADRKQSS